LSAQNFDPRDEIEEERKLAEFGDFLVEMGQGGFQGLAVVGIGGVGQIVADARARELEILDGVLAELLRRAFFDSCGRFPGFGGVYYLSFDVLAFPTSGHTVIFSQIA
jgi:hypothetical protein